MSMAGASFLKFLNSGTGKTGRSLGISDGAIYRQNAVELQFEIDPAATKSYRNLRPKQWAGTEAVWIKTGHPLTVQFTLHRRSNGSGADDPEAQNIFTSPTLIAYYDAPGPNVGSFLTTRPSRLYVVQNFTGWIVGDPIKGGVPEQLCEVAAWHSIVSLVDENWDDANAVPKWQRTYGNKSSLGWGDTSKPPPI